MGLPISALLEGDAPYEQDYHSEEGELLPASPPSMEEYQKAPAQEEDIEARRQIEGVRQGRRQRHLVRAVDRMPVEGHPSGLVRSLLQRSPRALPKVEKDGRRRDADEEDDRLLRQKAWRNRL